MWNKTIEKIEERQKQMICFVKWSNAKWSNVRCSNVKCKTQFGKLFKIK